MKRIIVLWMCVVVVVLSGCSIDIASSYSEQLEDQADSLEDTFEVCKETISLLKGKDVLDSKDQELIDSQIDKLIESIDDFKSTKDSLLTKVPKKIVVKELIKREEVLISIQAKVQEGEADGSDIDTLLEAISSDLEISFFN